MVQEGARIDVITIARKLRAEAAGRARVGRGRRVLGSAALVTIAALSMAGCASTGGSSPRAPLMKRLLASTVQLRTEREGGVRRAGSGVVVASDPATMRTWVLTAGHLVEPAVPQEITCAVSGRPGRTRAKLLASSPDPDLALLLIEGAALPPVRLRPEVSLGDEVWVVAYPWGRGVTVGSGVVSQIASPDGEITVAGAPRMVDVSVSYGSSGGGVFDAQTGDLIALVEAYRTARIALPRDPGASVQVPVAGETTVIPAATIVRFLTERGLGTLLPQEAEPRPASAP
jgi:hypothetical protein